MPEPSSGMTVEAEARQSRPSCTLLVIHPAQLFLAPGNEGLQRLDD